MRGLIVVLVCACSSGETTEDKRRPAQPFDASMYSDEPPWDAAAIDAPVVETGTVRIVPPRAKVSVQRASALLVARVPNGWRIPAVPTIDGETLIIPPGETVTLPEIANRATRHGVLVFVDRKAPFDEIADLAFALHRECWAIAIADDDVVGGAFGGDPCPSITPDGQPQIAIVIGHTGVMIGVTESRETFSVEFAAVTTKLRTLKPAKRTDLVYTVHPGVPVETVVKTTLAMHAAGFTGARWVPPPWIPMRISDVGTDPPPPPRPPPPPVTVTVGEPVLVGKQPGLTRDQVGRVFKSRVGIYRACYQKELNRTPGIKGTIEASFEIDRGVVTKVTTRGTLKHELVDTCLRSNVMRLRFPLVPQLTKVKVTLTFAAA
jgi:hypothetical protein